MAQTQLKLTISLLLLLPFAFFPSIVYANQETSTTEKKQVDIVVEGMVYCQSCDRFGTWSLDGAEPIPAAKIGVICKDHKHRVSFYKAYETDQHGYFYANLQGFKMGHSLLDHPLHACHVKLVSSPLENCNLLSNINYGLNGSPLRYEDKRLFGNNYEAVVYASGPLAFRPNHCSAEAMP